jgi:VRR-NUC domain-containing protein
MSTITEIKNYNTLIANAQAQYRRTAKPKGIKSQYQKAVDQQAKKQAEIDKWIAKKSKAAGVETRLRACKKANDYSSVTEAQLQLWTEVEAQSNGWEWFHDEDSRRNQAGFPDLVAAKWNHEEVWIELKKEGEKVKPGSKQERWLDILGYANRDVYELHPSQWEFIRSLFEAEPENVEVAA